MAKPRKPQPPSLPKVRALYDYNPQDLDELELKEGEIVEVLKERELRVIFVLSRVSGFLIESLNKNRDVIILTVDIVGKYVKQISKS